MNVPFIPVMIVYLLLQKHSALWSKTSKFVRGEGGYRQSVTALANTTPHCITILRSSGLGVFIGMIPGAGRILQLLLPITKLVVSVRHQKLW